jgi:translation initiation factor IF-3
LPTDQALKRAQEVGLDLVEVNPKGTPPVCKILDFGKYKYEEKKKAAEAKRKQTVVEVKEVKIRPKTDEHDLQVKIRAIRRFIEAGNKVKVVCRFRGREMMHPQVASGQLQEILKAIEDLVNLEQRPMMEQRTMAMLVSPKPVVFQRLQQLQRDRDKAREKGEHPANDRPLQSLEEEEELHEPDDDDDDDDDDEDEDGDEAGEEAEKKS